ncbi:hypothetical protein ACCO45_010130 [Purpureocillium lilacinum]|uniref:Uncharacterized protein n=1 Tax=Purpureocillium lilacinum TaxID=33203 RepID=A0ACC4DEQ8_PURLI
MIGGSIGGGHGGADAAERQPAVLHGGDINTATTGHTRRDDDEEDRNNQGRGSQRPGSSPPKQTRKRSPKVPSSTGWTGQGQAIVRACSDTGRRKLLLFLARAS